MTRFRTRLFQSLPILLLVILTAAGLASALQSDDEEIDLGPQPGDFLDENGEPDIAGYLVATATFDSAPPVPAGEAIEFRVFGCVEGEPLSIEFVPRILRAEEIEFNEGLTDDSDEVPFLEEPVVLVEEDALAEPSTHELTTPEGAPLGFARFRVTCVSPEGEELVTDTTINLVEREAFEEAQEDADPEDEPAELVTILDSGA